MGKEMQGEAKDSATGQVSQTPPRAEKQQPSEPQKATDAIAALREERKGTEEQLTREMTI
ncbi:MAG: hypothetical protein IID36_03305 [Planctomycetes bacterium]|nr:hypothetical protein [Planctomycetota bacterium]